MVEDSVLRSVRSQFPLLNIKVGNNRLVYLDNGATAQKPQVVIDRMNDFYHSENANIHRGVHYLSQKSTTKYEEVRTQIARHLNTRKSEEIIFTSGTTEGINLISHCFGSLLKPGDEVLITEMEHHSNIVPWHILKDAKEIKLKYIPLTNSGELDLSRLDELLSSRTKLASIVHVSNSLGTVNPIAELIRKVHNVGGKVLIDAAQSLQHFPIDVQSLDCDFLVFSGHKVFGPTGTGVLYGKEELLNAMPPFKGGGDMIKTVNMLKTEYAELPHKFEAGTPNICGVIGMGVALDWLSLQDRAALSRHEDELLNYATLRLSEIEGMEIIGNAAAKCGILSFVINGLHHYDIGTLLNEQGIAVRTGHHCTQPVMDFFKVPGTVRASFSVYNTIEEVDLLASAIKKAVNILR